MNALELVELYDTRVNGNISVFKAELRRMVENRQIRDVVKFLQLVREEHNEPRVFGWVLDALDGDA